VSYQQTPTCRRKIATRDAGGEIAMKILALEYESPSADPDLMEAYLVAEARRVLELTQTGIIREIYFRAEKREAVLMLECADAHEARDVLATLPLVQAGLIAFEVIPLVPYNGLSRLIDECKRPR